ncbi:MAG: peptidylprolyl isomerase [Anaerolineae bacterium]
MPDKVTQNAVVSLQYRLYLDEDGSLVEESQPGDDLVYLHGHNNIISGLENALTGMTVGERKTVIVEPEDAYGEYDPDDTLEIDRSELPGDFEPEVGMVLEIEEDSGHVTEAEVVAIDDETITLDFNHPLAGERLRFEVTITSLRDATPEELRHGHAHGEGGHHH